MVFMGTPDFAAHILQNLMPWPGGDVVAVYSQPDRPSGRGHKVVPPPVKQEAMLHGLPVLQPLHFKDPATCAELTAFKPDVLVVAAYGLILPQAVLNVPTLAPVNVHASLLPSYRGAAPIQRAIMDGCAQTGVSIMRMEVGLDSGPVYALRSVPTAGHTAGSLHHVLASLGAELLLEVLADMADGRAVALPQQDHLASHAPKMRKEESFIMWNRPSVQVDAHIRAVLPWPGARLALNSLENSFFDLRIGPCALGPPKAQYGPNIPAGELWRLHDGLLAMSCQDNFLVLGIVRPQNKKDMSASDFANGYLRKGMGCLARLAAL